MMTGGVMRVTRQEGREGGDRRDNRNDWIR